MHSFNTQNLCGDYEPKQQWDDKFGIIEKHHEFEDLEDNYTQRMKEQNAAEDVKILGVGKNAPIVTNKKGGRQSESPIAMHLVDPSFLNDWFNSGIPNFPLRDDVIMEITDFMESGGKNSLLNAIFEVNCIYNKSTNENTAITTIAKVLKEGAEKYEANNWRLIPQEEHINHALIHYIAYLLEDKQDDHLAHCMCRLMMAYATEKSENFEYNKYVKKLHEGM